MSVAGPLSKTLAKILYVLLAQGLEVLGDLSVCEKSWIEDSDT